MRISFSPYTYARVAVMKSQLLGKADYDRLLKMGYHELLRTLQDSKYKEEMEKYGVSSGSLDVVERALNANLMNTFQKLHRIAQEGMKEAIAEYLRQYDIENIKTILRGKYTGTPRESIQNLLYSSVNYPPSFWQNLLGKENVDDIIAAIPFVDPKKLASKELFVVENALDHAYLDAMEAFAGSVRGQGTAIIEFLLEEIEMTNIRTILRLRSRGEEADKDIVRHIIKPSPFVKQLAKQKTVQDIIHLLHKHKRTSMTGSLTGWEDDGILKLEMELERALLKKEIQLMHRDMLSANYILGFMFAKEIEVRNLKALIKGRKLGVEEDYLETMVIVS